MEEKNLTFELDPTNLASMRELMDKYGNSTTMYTGVNTEGEDVMISIAADNIVCSTNQRNGWVRQNVYWRDGTCEELYEGRW